MKLVIFILLIFTSELVWSEIRNTKDEVILGIEILHQSGFRLVKGKRIGLITNHTGKTKKGVNTIDLLYTAPAVKLVALFCPEHGIRGTEDDNIASSTDTKTGLPIYSLYGKTKKPTPAMLNGIEVLVFDIQDIGTRFYTYITTMALAMEAAKENKISFLVLDRPNPITGIVIEGNLTHPQFWGGFTTYYPLPVRHGMTVGELAQLINEEKSIGFPQPIGCKLQVVKMRHWRRAMWFDETGIPWVNTSPNMRSLNAALLYPGIAYFEAGTNVTEGRGTDKPFEYVGAPWINTDAWIHDLQSRKIEGIEYVPVKFTPDLTAPIWFKYRGEECNGIYLKVTDRNRLRSVELGLHLVDSIFNLYPDKFVLPTEFDLLAGNPNIRESLLARLPVPEIITLWQNELNRFLTIRKKYLLYE